MSYSRILDQKEKYNRGDVYFHKQNVIKILSSANVYNPFLRQSNINIVPSDLMVSFLLRPQIIISGDRVSDNLDRLHTHIYKALLRWSKGVFCQNMTF